MGKIITKLVHIDQEYVDHIKKRTEDITLHPSEDSQQFFLSKFSIKNLKQRNIPHMVIKSYQEENIPVKIVHPAHSLFFSPPNEEAIEEIKTYALSKLGKKKSTTVVFEGRFIHGEQIKENGTFCLDRPGGKRNYRWSIAKHGENPQDIREKFPKMKAMIKDPQTKVILSLGSGGIRSFAHPTLMKFINLLGLRDSIDEIWGCSGGSVIGLPFSLGVDPEIIEEEGYHLYNDRYSIKWSPNKLQVVKNLITDQFLPFTENMLKGFMECQNDLQVVFGKYLKKKNGNHQIPFYCVAYNILNQRLESLTSEKLGRAKYSHPIIHTDPLDAVVASSSIPIIFVPKKILSGGTEHHYVDGGTMEEVPMISPYHKWSDDREAKRETRKKLLIISVDLFPRVSESGFFYHWFIKKLPAIRLLQLFAKYTDLVRQGRIEEQKQYVLKNPHVKTIDLFLPMGGTAVLDPIMIPQVIESAQTSFYNQLRSIEASLPH
ncbi:MAG: patatin-like phospholipase family protein [Deltaproteobacteria bacterium]|nr:patatin-like phospholipase family protein [Deltaproteobacteria bacterium]